MEAKTYVEILAEAFFDPINLGFFLIISCLFIYGFNLDRNEEKLRKNIPSICSSIGVFGTFLGIFLGIGGLDFDNIEKTMPALLNGMKTAFFSSLIGMMASMFLKFKYSFDQDESVNQTIKTLEQLSKNTVNTTDSIYQLGALFTKLFTSQEEETSLVSQVALIRKEISDSHKATQEAFREMIDSFSNTASKSLVDEMRKVIEQFNVMLGNLVSKSFEELKDSTIRLNKWQEEYKNIIINIHDNLSNLFIEINKQNNLFNEHNKNIDTLSTKFDSIDKSLSSITYSGKELDYLAENIRIQNETINESLEAINNVGDKAAEVIPQISNTIDGMINQAISSSQKFNNSIDSLVENIKSNINSQCLSLHDNINNQQDNINKFLTNIALSINENINKTSDIIAKNAENFESYSNKFSKNISESVSEQQDRIIDFIEEEIVSGKKYIQGQYLSLQNNINEQQKNINDFLNNVILNTTNHINNINDTISKNEKIFIDQMKSSIEEQQNQITSFIKDATTENQNHVTGMHEGMQEALARAMGEFANGVGQVSLRFTTDYSSLVDKLTKFVQGMNDIAKLQDVLNVGIKEIANLQKNLKQNDTIEEKINVSHTE